MKPAVSSWANPFAGNRRPLRALTGAAVLLGSLLALLRCGSMDSAAVGSIAGNAAEGMAGAVGLSEGTARSIGSGVRAGAATWADAVKAADSLTAENEYYLGRAVAANIAARYPVYTRDPAMTVYLNKICSALVINSPRPDIYAGYHVAILDTMEINAFATPGGHIFVTRGLLGCAANEDALASVIAHEIAHIQLRHALMSIRNARYINAAVSGVLAGLGEGLGGSVKELTGVMGDSVNEIITTMVSNGYAKDQELEADAQALALLAAAGYQPAAILDMLAALEQVQQGRPGFSKTHPPPAERISGVNKHLARYRISDTRSYRVRRFAVAVPR